MQLKLTKIVLALSLSFGLSIGIFGQNTSGYRIARYNLGSSGSSGIVPTSKGTYKISQSIGQASVIGTYYSNGYYLRQGYQQPLSKITVERTIDFELIAKIHPNPFRHHVNITFNSVMTSNIDITLIDISGKVIKKQSLPPSQSIQLELSDIAIGTYILKLFSAGKQLDTKLIKI